MKGETRNGLVLLDHAEQIYRREKDDSGLALTLTRRATAHRFIGDYSISIRDADEVIAITSERYDLQSLYAEALRLKGLALFRLGQTRQSVEFLERSLNLYTRLNETSSIPILLMETGMVYYLIGNYSEAGSAYEKASHIWRQDGNLSWLANLLNNLGVLRHIQGDYEKASLAYEEGLVCAQRSNYTRMEALIALGLGDLYAELEDFSAAQNNYQQAQETVEALDDRFLLFYLIMARAGLALLQKNPGEAHKWIADAAGMIQTGDSLYEKALLNLALGRLSLLEGDASQAVSRLEEAERCFSEDGRKLEGDTARIWLAAAYHQRKNEALAGQKMKSVWSGRGRVEHAVLVACHQARGWLEGLQKEPEIGRAVRDIFTSVQRFENNMPAVRRQLRRQARIVEMPAPGLAIQGFGRATVIVGGKSLSSSDWQTHSVRELFFFFLASQKPLTKEQVGEALWPDVDEPSKLRLRFKNEIYRLRRAVGQDVVLYENDVYRFNRSLDYEYDVEAFEAYVSRARSSRDPETQIELYQRAVDLVRGPYLDDMYMDWVYPERERLSQLYLDSLLALAELYQREAQLEKALVTCQRAIKYEPTFEQAYQLSMRLYKRLGDRPSVTRTYQACRDALKRLDLSPSRETEVLYRELIA
jgi:two-component SAPR family response regulator/predicted negative regulator of RcsB-dependent stress response